MKHNNDNGFRTLPSGTILENNYKILSVLGDGGFGITYKGFDILHKTEVAIKEYFPHEFAYRAMPSTSDTVNYTIYPLQSSQKIFETGKEHFLREATVLRNLEHLASIVTVLDILKTTGTIYIVMEYIEGITLQNYVQNNGALSYQELLPMMLPIMKDLQQIHESGLIHRDISPDNLILGMDNRLHLIDFGSSTHFYNTGKSVTTVFLKSGYAPPEQYLKNGKQGPWIDVYGLCATMYMALTRIQPPDSLNRIQADNLPSLITNSDAPRSLAKIIEKGMSLKIADRYPSMSSLYKEIMGHTKIKQSHNLLYSIALLIIVIGLFILYIIGHPVQSNAPEPTGTVPANISSEESDSNSTNQDSTPEASDITTEVSGTASKESDTATEDSGTTSNKTENTAATNKNNPKNDTTEQSTKAKDSNSSYKVLPIEEDEYHVLPIEED